ncbi:WD40 repeat-like protein [Wallemia mellicola]|uniref:WD40 repeat-like protein n=1 Tax=Wallemia mellicola TaxID=1708541 RepID=A0A4T0R0V9_9BASI|nr:WD40 repeat-like protein [Wallemia mellicola]
MSKISLNADIMKSFKPSKAFTGYCQEDKQFTSIAFDDTGSTCVTAASDDGFHIFDARLGNEKYGIDLPCFTHASSTILYASTKVDNSIKYHSLHDNTYLQYFRGHNGKVNSLEMSPVSDQFLSASSDDTVRLWDIRSPQCMGLLNIQGNSTAAWDPTGLIFAVSLYKESSILLYDTKEFDKAPFMTFVLQDKDQKVPGRSIYPHPTCIKFSTDGNYMLVGTNSYYHYILNSFTGQIYYRLTGHETFSSSQLHRDMLSWTPDSNYVVGGSKNGKIFVWEIPPFTEQKDHEARNLSPIVSTDNHNKEPSKVVSFNPKMIMMATAAGSELDFWLPMQDSRRSDH